MRENRFVSVNGEVDSTDVSLTEIFNQLPVAIYTCNSLGYLSSFNKAALTLWGREPELGKDLYGGPWQILTASGKVLPPDSSPMARSLIEGIAIKGEQIIIRRQDGNENSALVYSVPGFDDKGKITGVTISLVDFNYLGAVAEKQAILASIIDTSDDAIISKTLQGIITSWNKAAEKMFGYTENEVLGKHISIIIPPDRLKEEDFIIGNVSKGNKIDHFETERRAKDGGKVFISLSVSPVKDYEGNIIGASKIARDISEKKLADEKQAILAAIVDTSDDAIISKTLEGIITSWNKAAEKTFGYTEEEVLGKHISLIIPQDRLSEEDLILGNIRQGNKIDHFETVRRSKTGRDIPISLSVSPIKDNRGIVIGASKIARDISVLKTALEESRKHVKNLEIINALGKEISENLDINVILQKVTDATTGLTGAQFGAFFYNSFNSAGELHTRYSLSGASKNAFEKFGMPRNTAIFNQTFSGEGIVRSDNITKDPNYGKNPPYNGIPPGHLPVVSYLAVPVKSNSGEVIGGLFYGHPEEAKFTQEHENLVLSISSQASIALENAKLYKEVITLNAKKDEFIGMASHELKTPLTSISGYLQILERMELDNKSRTFVSKTVQQVKKLASLVADLLDVSKIEAGKLQLVKRKFDIKKALEDSIDLIQNSQKSHTIQLITDTKGLLINADLHRIEQLLINLLTNAIKYSPASHKVEVYLQQEGENVKVGIRDWGIGIQPDKRNQIFGRFYRVEGLNPSLSGLGIGLYICKEVVDRHHGKLWVDSEYGKGSTFWFTLPIN